MQKPAKLPTEAGVYLVVHGQTKVVYIGYCNDLAHRYRIWEGYFRKRQKDPKYKIPIANLPDHPSNEWTFMPFVTNEIEKIKEHARKAGYKFINKQAKQRKLFTVGGKTATLTEHAKDAGLKYSVVYHKVSKGEALENILKEGIANG